MAKKDRYFRSQTDRDFDELADRFSDTIYGSLKGQIRLVVLERDFDDSGIIHADTAPLRILDAGCGVGQFSCRLAAQGHAVTLAEPSKKMLQLADAYRAENHPQLTVDVVNKSVQDLPQSLGQYDLVLFHAVLEWLIEPLKTLELLLPFIRPGGHLSLLFYNRQSLVMRHLTLGNFYYIENNQLSGIGRKTLTPLSPQNPDDIRHWFRERSYEELCFSGVRCFYDYMPKHERDRCKDDDILRLELQHSRQDPYRELARYAHLLLRKS